MWRRCATSCATTERRTSSGAITKRQLIRIVPLAEAAALRELSVILVVLLGMRYLKEPFGGPRLLACGLVLAGMLVMKL